jgi:sulfatase maturation enzyme AslB (radical SAM superfamily)
MVPTNRCNMACVYCHAKAGSVSDRHLDMTEEVLYRTVDFFFSVPRQGRKEMKIEFQGGEPLLRYDLVQKVMDYAMERAEAEGVTMRFAIVTNLTLMNDEIAKDIKKRGNVNLCSSLDGPSVVHDKQRVYPGGRGTYQHVVHWAEKLKEEYGIRVPFLPTFTVNGLGHEREIVDEYIQRGVNSMYLRYVNYTGRAYESGYEVGVTPEQFVGAWKRTLEYVLEKNPRGPQLPRGQDGLSPGKHAESYPRLHVPAPALWLRHFAGHCGSRWLYPRLRWWPQRPDAGHGQCPDRYL